jgi:sugar-specific transcriptional regulator TrmB
MSSSVAITALVNLGLTDLEARAYVLLLEASPATGYRVAQSLGKTAASIYKTLESLERKGMILVEEGEHRLCRAVPFEEMLGRLERDFQVARAQATEALSEVETATGDDRIYQIRSRVQVLGRSRIMLQRAKCIIVADLFPAPLAELRTDLEEAAARGVEVRAKIYESDRIRGAETVINCRRGLSVTERPYDWLGLVVDGSEHLLATLGADGESVVQATWSGSPYLSWIYHCGIESEILLDRIAGVLEEGGDRSEITRILMRYRNSDPHEIPGFVERMRRLGASPGQNAKEEGRR